MTSVYIPDVVYELPAGEEYTSKAVSVMEEDVLRLIVKSNGEISIQTNGNLEIETIQILDLNGRVLASLPYSETITINKKAGVYLVRLLNKEDVIGTRKIMIN